MSCAVSNEITIRNDGSGFSNVKIVLDPLSVAYMSDLMESFGGGLDEGTALFDIVSIRAAFAARKGVELVGIEPEGADVLRLEIEFDDVGAILDSETTDNGHDAEPISFRSAGPSRELKVHFSRENFSGITGLFVLPDSPITVLVPYTENDFLSRDEYLEVTQYAFEDYLEGRSMEDILTSSGISVAVEPPGTITRVLGGSTELPEPNQTAGQPKATFFIPLLDILTLEEDLIFSVSWQ